MMKMRPVISRGALLRTDAIGALLVSAKALLPLTVPAKPTGPADRILTGGTILTMEDAAPRVEALAIRDGLILAAGTEAEVMVLAGPDTVLTDLGGLALLPGFF